MGKKILIADDSLPTLKLIKKMLENVGYETVLAKNGFEAIMFCRKESPNLIILDIDMPKLDGFEFCKRIKAWNQQIPILFISASKSLDVIEKALGMGAEGYISKPITQKTILPQIEKWLEVVEIREVSRQLENDGGALNAQLVVESLARAAMFRESKGFLQQHSVRTGYYAYHLTKASGGKEREALIILNAMLVHDIGKIGLPDILLNDVDSFSEEEQQHTVMGAQIIGDHDSMLLQSARIIALRHHEQYDGNGYPDGLPGDEIPKIGRIAAIADAFDRLTVRPGNREPWGPERAKQYLETESGKKFDPQLVNLFSEKETFNKVLEVHKTFTVG